MKSVVFVLLAGFVNFAFAGEWFVDQKAKCKVWNESPKTGESVAWSGNCAEGFADGKGLVQWYVEGRPSARFEGSLVKGKMEGTGTYFYSSGGRYTGEWVDGRPEGKGVHLFSDGSKYDGEVSNGKRDGFGVLELVKSNSGYESHRSGPAEVRVLGDRLIARGWFVMNSFRWSCETAAACRRLVDQEARALRDAEARPSVGSAIGGSPTTLFSCSYSCRKSGIGGYTSGAPAGTFAVTASSDSEANQLGERFVGPNGSNVCRGEWYLKTMSCRR